LHPAQRQFVERNYSGPAQVSGSARTGKTIVAVHRAAYLARRHPNSRVLLTTFSETLANALRTKLRRLTSNKPLLAERLGVYALNAIAASSAFVPRGSPTQISSTADSTGCRIERSKTPRRLFADGMGRDGRRFAARWLGGVSRRQAPGPGGA
jgi:superfamily I DNA/RNA helicase